LEKDPGLPEYNGSAIVRQGSLPVVSEVDGLSLELHE
jgi:hypothetical protein